MSTSTTRRTRRRSFGVDRATTTLVTWEEGRMWIDPAFQVLLSAARLNTFDAMMQTSQGRCLRALADRENWRLELSTGDGTRVMYLKKHHTRTWWSWLRARMGRGAGETPGRIEARNVSRLESDGIASMRLIAFGERLHPDGQLESFVLTDELAGFTQLDHFLRQRFPTRQSEDNQTRNHDFFSLMSGVAAVARAFHQAGYNHRDLYCCHFFVREHEPGVFQVNLIDLQRVENRRLPLRRWRIKDLAQLAYSAPRERISCADKLAFMKLYLGVQKLRPCDKQLIRQVLAKQRMMERRLGVHP